jgi:ubiquinol-cytochrome c reductase iron-sulfur subunit
VGYALAPFIQSWWPSERAQAAGAPVEVDISKLDEGARITVEWRGQPVWIVKRTPQMLAALPTLNDQLRDPDSNQSVQPPYAKNINRSMKPEILVMKGVCTHLGCSPTYRPDVAPPDLGPTWKGGFFCPCHGSKFDLAGRVFQGVPAPLNMEVPPYQFITDTLVVVGAERNA